MSENLRDLQRLVKSLYSDIAELPLLAPKEAPAPRPDLSAYEDSIRFCRDCSMHIGRGKLVFGRGSPNARVVFVGDFPSDADDASGKIFSDAAGELLDKMIVAMKLRPDDVYLVNLLQCRVPRGSRPSEADLLACAKHLRHQLDSIRPTHIVALGELAARTLTRTDSPLLKLRNQKFELDDAELRCTHHPRDLISEPAKKKEAWGDLQIVMRSLGLA